MKNIKQALDIFWRRLRRYLNSFDLKDPKAIAGAAFLVLVLILYTISRLAEHEARVVQVIKEGEFKGKPIMGNASAAVSEARENSYAKSANEIISNQKSINDGLKKMEQRLTEIEQKTQKTIPDSSLSVATPAQSASIAPDMTNYNAEAIRVGAAPEVYTSGRVSGGEERYSKAPVTSGMGFIARTTSRGPEIISFPVASDSAKEEAGVVLPVGSYVKAKIIAGTDATTGEPDPVLLQLDYSSILPNQRKLDLSGCFMTAKAQADLSTERVKMKTLKLSCVSKRGLVFEKEVNGYVADDKDNKFAVSGPVNSKQGRVASMAFLAAVVEGVGKAVQQAQTSQQTTLGGSQAVVTGDEQKYLAGGAASNAAGMVAQWYLKQAESLLPSITVGSGRDVWIVVLDNVNLPETYFKKEDEKDARFSYLTRILD